MAFDMQSFKPEEARLFIQLPLEDRYMGFGAVGHVRAELEWDDYHHMWCPERKSLAAPAFKRELNHLLGALRSKKGIFYKCLTLASVWNSIQSLENGGKGFKIKTADYSYYVQCCLTERYGYDITIYAYDNSFLLPELAGKHKLPDHCYSVLPDSGDLVVLQQERPYIQTFITEDPAEVRQQVADDLNGAMGVTKAQAAAMLMGALHGFGQPCAWPWQYDKNGEPRGNDMQKNKERETR
jgi:hypothetical protein